MGVKFVLDKTPGTGVRGKLYLVKVELANVVDFATQVRPVGKDLTALSDREVNVVGAAGRVARVNGVELGNAFVVGGLDTAKEGALKPALVLEARVDAGGVWMPDVH